MVCQTPACFGCGGTCTILIPDFKGYSAEDRLLNRTTATVFCSYQHSVSSTPSSERRRWTHLLSHAVLKDEGLLSYSLKTINGLELITKCIRLSTPPGGARNTTRLLLPKISICELHGSLKVICIALGTRHASYYTAVPSSSCGTQSTVHCMHAGAKFQSQWIHL